MNNKHRFYKLRSIKIGWLNEQMYHLLLKKEKKLSTFIQLIKIVVFIINIVASTIGNVINYRWWTISASIIIAFDIYINKIREEAAYGSKIELHRSMTDECFKFNDLLESTSVTMETIENSYNTIIEKSSKLHIDPSIFAGWDDEFRKRGIKELNAFDLTEKISKEIRNDNPPPAKIEESEHKVMPPNSYDTHDSYNRPASADKSVQFALENPIDKSAQIAVGIQAEYSPRLNNPSSTSTTSKTKNKKADFELQQLFNNLNIKADI